MKFSSTAETLTTKLQQLAALAPSRLGAEALMAHMKIEAKAGALRLTATDGELELSARVSEGVEMEAQGQAYVPARKMAELYAKLGREVLVEVNSAEGAITLKYPGGNMSLNAVGESNMRLFSSEEGEEGLVLDLAKQDLLDLMQKTSFAMASGDVRHYLNGMLLEFAEGEVRTVSTDAHRLAYARKTLKEHKEHKEAQDNGGAEGESEEEGEKSCIVPRKAVQELGKLLTGANETINLKVSKHRLVAELGDYRLTCRLVDGRYPDYTKVIPQDNHLKAVVDKQEFQACLGRADILAADEPGKTVNLRFRPDWLQIEASNAQQDRFSEEIPVQFSGREELRIAFSAAYIKDFLNSCDYNNIQIELKDKESRSIMRGEGEEDSFYLLMPVLL